jgi:hypothetical protein
MDKGFLGAEQAFGIVADFVWEVMKGS